MQHNRKHNFNIFNVTALVCALLICSSHFAYANATESTQRSILSAVQSIYNILGPKSGYPYNIWDIDYRIWDNTSTIGQNVDFIMTDIDNMGSAIAEINAKTKDYTSYIDNLEPYVNDINNIDWITNSSSFLRWEDLNGNVISSYGSELSDPIVAVFESPTYQDVDLYRFNLGIEAWNNNNSKIDFIDHIEIYNFSGQLIPENDYICYRGNTGLYIYSRLPNSGQIYINIYPKANYFLYNNSSLQYISKDKLDAYIVEDNFYLKMIYIAQDSTIDLLNRFKDIYASDDLIDAKENQQAYEDQAITDFTGSGSAAASGSDTTNMKNVSGAIKSGLDSGGSVNGALSVFNTSGGLWDWFSQSNYEEINGPQTRSRRSDEYIDFYNINREELEELLGEYR